MNKNPANKAYFIALASAAFLSSTAILIRYLTLNYKMPALVLAFWRDFFVVFTILPILFIRRRDLLKITPPQGKFLFIYGFILAIFNSFWTLSVAFNGAAVATVLCYCSAAFTAILGRWLLKEVLNFKTMDKLVDAYRGWIGDAIIKGDRRRDKKWTESVAVGSELFVRATKEKLGIKAKGREVFGTDGSYELREDAARYEPVLGLEKVALSSENAYYWSDTF